MKRILIASILLLGLLLTSVSAVTLAPDGTYVSGDSAEMAPDGSFVGGKPQMTPDGSFVGGKPTMAPDGSFVGE